MKKEAKEFENERSDSNYDLEELEKGIKIETEHTGDLEIAKLIAKDHLDEISDYYSKLEVMERKDKMTVADKFIKARREKEAENKREAQLPGRFSPGPGRGRGPGREGGFGLGPGGNCICPQCGEKVAHKRTTPCYLESCPKCGSKMIRERD